jgi:hypothetical protein
MAQHVDSATLDRFSFPFWLCFNNEILAKERLTGKKVISISSSFGHPINSYDGARGHAYYLVNPRSFRGRAGHVIILGKLSFGPYGRICVRRAR